MHSVKHSFESMYCREPKCESSELCLQVREFELTFVLSKLLTAGVATKQNILS